MSIKLFILTLSFFIIIVLVNVQSVFAITPPDFPACNNPPDSIRAEHNDGLHGVAGNVSEYRGKDTVYNVNGGHFLQCLCTEDNEGIQTNWWKISSLSDTDVQVLKNQGWYYIVDGALWGLDNVPYMAKNNEYACRESLSGIGGGDVLGLASTGNKTLFYSVLGISIGLMFLLLGFFLLRKGK